MRIGVLSYPMLFQRDGGLQVQVRETIAALNALPQSLSVQLVDVRSEPLASYDLIHVFSAINGNHRLVETAQEAGVPVVLSPLVSPGWDRTAGLRARLAERCAGRLTGWQVQTSYAQMRRALELADLLIALGPAEQAAIAGGFGIGAERIRIIPNGIAPRFFEADPRPFRQQTGIDGAFVLMVGAISPYKNQLGLAQAMKELGVPLVLIGRAARSDELYLQALQRLPWVRLLGGLLHESPLLAGAYAAASVLALPSRGEVFPLTVLEAMAAGTPVVMTRESALAIDGAGIAVQTVRWDDQEGLARALRAVLAAPPERQQVRQLVARYSWPKVAGEMADCYAALLRGELRRAVSGR
ncbi:glycosyltransferase [Massilia endophytica]|uniref:glycosyltransferase n=1 Tax=Massilia endophytica TaxID=2899220 RepID=UPI001E427293|nr:glycosyltransferase [Massilia endophytica]UGQ48549.1 glycosyltransferase [Massilia endophytica]